MKRSFDLSIAVVCLVLLIIPLFILSLIVVSTSKGSALYWSKRIGKDNKSFYMPKFRTMTTQTPEVATHLLEDPSHFYTPVGEFLRKYSIDELPQLYSILIGDMSLVGPRPALHNQDDLIELRTEAGIHNLVPGITGLAQVSGRDELTLKNKVEIDKLYLLRKSFSYDLYIIWLTVAKVVKGVGISH
jgi:O-antigen biosynthesis protein WbqP